MLFAQAALIRHRLSGTAYLVSARTFPGWRGAGQTVYGMRVRRRYSILAWTCSLGIGQVMFVWWSEGLAAAQWRPEDGCSGAVLCMRVRSELIAPLHPLVLKDCIVLPLLPTVARVSACRYHLYVIMFEASGMEQVGTMMELLGSIEWVGATPDFLEHVEGVLQQNRITVCLLFVSGSRLVWCAAAVVGPVTSQQHFSQ